jgi:hypothetical protein
LPSWILIRNPGPDTDPGTLIESGSNPDPDPQHYKEVNKTGQFVEKIMMPPLKETSECVNCPLLQLPPDKIHSFVLFHLIIINMKITINF